VPDAKYLAIDPGKTTGWATFAADGSGITMGQADIYGLFELLAECPADVYITEDYRLYPWKSKEQNWSQLDTVRIIGMIQYHCYLFKKQLILQGANIKSIGYMWAGIEQAKSHSKSHERDAYVHGVYYLQNQGIRKPQQGMGK